MSGSVAVGVGSEHQVPGPGPGPDCHCPPPESHVWWPSCSPPGRSWQSWPLRERWPGGKSQPPQLWSRGKRARTHERGTQAPGGLDVPLRPLHNQEFDMTSPSMHGLRPAWSGGVVVYYINVACVGDSFAGGATNLLPERSNSYEVFFFFLPPPPLLLGVFPASPARQQPP